MLKRCAWWVPCTFALAATASAVASENEFPARPITLLVSNAPGSQADLLGRIVAEGVARKLGKSVIVENRAGASGIIAAKATASAAPDGYTLLLGSSGVMVINPHVYKTSHYDVKREFVPVAGVASSPSVIVVSSSAKEKSLEELIRGAQNGPPTTFGSLGPGATTNIVSQLFGRSTSLKLTEVPYTNEPAIINDLVAKRLDFSILPIASTLSFIQAGRLKALAVAAEHRSDSLPGVPTTAEAGHGTVKMTQWFGIFAPAGTPQERITKISDAVSSTLTDADMVERIARLGVLPARMNRNEFQQFFNAQYDDYKAIVTTLGIKVD